MTLRVYWLAPSHSWEGFFICKPVAKIYLEFIVYCLYICCINTNKKMKIPKALLEKWDTLKSPGDAAAIAEKADVSAEYIRQAFRKEECTDEIFEAIAEYYDEKFKIISKYL